MNLGARVKKAREHAGLTQAGLADAIRSRFKNGIKQQTIAKLENRGKSTRYIAEISSICGVNPDWLATGEGDWLGPGGDPLSPQALRIAGMYDKLPPFLQTQVALFIEMQCALFDAQGHQFPRQISKSEAEFYKKILEDRQRRLAADQTKTKK